MLNRSTKEPLTYRVKEVEPANLLAQKSNHVTTKEDSTKERRNETDNIETKATHGEPHHKAFMLSKRQLACTELSYISPE